VINERDVVYERRTDVADNGRSLSAIVNDLKIEAKAFINTRLEMLKTEMKQKVSAWTSAIPLIAAGVVFLGTAWLVLTAALVCIIAVAFGPGMMSWFYATIIVGGAYLLIGGAAAFLALSEIRKNNLKPERTMRVLRQDQVWLQKESSSAAADLKDDLKIRKVA